LYQYIRAFDTHAINTSAEESSYFELFDEIHVHFNKLMEAYQVEKG